MTFNICIIAGEESGDLIGRDFLCALKNAHSSMQAFGIGGRYMQEQGLDILLPMDFFSFIGIDFIKNLYSLRKNIHWLINEILQRNPIGVITIDVPVLSLYIARSLRKLNYKGLMIHYVMPTIWAWRPRRLFAFQAVYDHLFALFPFEMKYAKEISMPCTYVGHPLFFQDWNIFLKKKLHFDHMTYIALLPGSRCQEIRNILPIFCETIQKLDTFIIPIIPIFSHTQELVNSIFQKYNIFYIPVLQREKYYVLKKCRAALVASGTATLEIGFLKIPMVIAYKVSIMSFIVGSLLLYTKFIGLINILAKKQIVPERLQNNASPEILSEDLKKILGNDGRLQIHKVSSLLNKFKLNGEISGERAVNVFLSLLNKKQ